MFKDKYTQLFLEYREIALKDDNVDNPIPLIVIRSGFESQLGTLSTYTYDYVLVTSQGRNIPVINYVFDKIYMVLY